MMARPVNLRSSLLPATAAAVEVGRRSRLMQSPMLTRSVLTIPLPSEPMSTRLTCSHRYAQLDMKWSGL